MTAEKRKKRKRKSKSSSASGPSSGPPSGGGLLQSMRSGIRQVAGVEVKHSKPSRLSNIIWTIVLIAAVGLLLYRFYG